MEQEDQRAGGKPSAEDDRQNDSHAVRRSVAGTEPPHAVNEPHLAGDEAKSAGNSSDTTKQGDVTGLRSSLMTPAIARMTEQMLNSPTARMAEQLLDSPTMRMGRQLAEMAQNMQRLAWPAVQPPIVKVLSDPAFLRAFDSMRSLSLPASGVYDSLQWRGLADSLTTTQHLLLARQIAPLQDAMLRHAQFLTSAIDSTASFRKLANSVSQTLQGVLNWQQLFPNVKRLRKSIRLSMLASFQRADLWPAPSMPVALLDKIGQLAPGGDLRPVMLAVWNYYAGKNHAALEQAIARWDDDPEFAARRQIFSEALRGHRAKLYALTIPALLAQVEGIASDFVHGGASAGSVPKLGKTDKIVRYMIETAGNAGITDPDEADLLHVVLVEAVIEHVQKVSFEYTDFAAQYADIRQRRSLNRHGTLHGIQINYSSAMNSLRCFLLLDALYALRKHARQIAADSQ